MPSRALRIGGRVLAGVVAVGGAVTLVLGASVLPTPALAAPGAAVTPVAVDQHRVCTGPLLKLGDASGATATTSFGWPDVTAGTLSAPGAAVSAVADVDVAVSTDGATSSLLSAPSAAGPEGLLAAAQAQSVADADTAGLAVASCGEGAASSWFLAGATDTGRSSILLLANPNPVAASVDLSLYTADGPVQAPGLNDIVVAPLSQRALSLAGYAPGAAQLAVNVRSKGGLVSAALQHSIVRGLEPGGVDVVGRTAAAATEQLIPGVRITTSAAAAARAQVGGSQDVQTIVRLLSPQADATVTIGAAPEAAGGAGTSLSVEAHAGKVLDVPLGVLADGTYTVTVRSAEPVLAAARASTVAPPDPNAASSDSSSSSASSGSGSSASGSGAVLDGGGDGAIGYDVVGTAASGGNVVAGERIDVAWFVPGGPVTASTAFATASGPAPRLALAAASNAPVSVTLKGGGGEQKVQIGAGASAGVDLQPGTVYVLTATAPVAASVSYAGDGQLAAYPVRPANPLATPLTIYR